MYRYFYPIGQGAFYAEKHEKFTIVYDCGDLKRTKKAKSIVQRAFQKDEIIDILFISHLDFDHVSQINTLKSSVKKIRRVILPLLSKENKTLLSVAYKAMDEKALSRLIIDPVSFFGDSTQITYVTTEVSNNSIELDLEELSGRGEIYSGAILKSREVPDWVLIPYNIKFEVRSKIFKKELHKAGFDLDRLLNDQDYVENILIYKLSKNKLKSVYEKLDGGINENCMLLYSGPSNEKISDSPQTHLIFLVY